MNGAWFSRLAMFWASHRSLDWGGSHYLTSLKIKHQEP
jgi:hypothetical protein